MSFPWNWLLPNIWTWKYIPNYTINNITASDKATTDIFSLNTLKKNKTKKVHIIHLLQYGNCFPIQVIQPEHKFQNYNFTIVLYVKKIAKQQKQVKELNYYKDASYLWINGLKNSLQTWKCSRKIPFWKSKSNGFQAKKTKPKEYKKKR
jgi:hypothetical protein